MSMRARALACLLAAPLLAAGLAGCGSSVDTKDPSSVAAGMLTALAKSDCAQVIKLYPGAPSDEHFSEHDCSNEMAGARAVGNFTCALDDAEQSATHVSVRCKSDEDPDTVWSAGVERATDGWVVTAVSAI